MKYKVTIREVKELEVEIDAEDEESAVDEALYKFDKGEIEFPDYFNYENVDFTAKAV